MFYYENQQGGLCRKHALNAFFGKELLKVEDFYRFCDLFDKACGQPKGTSKTWVYVDNDWNLISYVIYAIRKVYFRFYSLNHFPPEGINNMDCGFQFDKGHIWFIKKDKGRWYRIDSMGGIRQISPPTKTKSYGYIFPSSKVVDTTIFQSK